MDSADIRGPEATSFNDIGRVPASGQRRAGWRRWRAGAVVGRAILALFGLYVALPLYWLIVSSMKSTHELYTMNGLVPPSHVSSLIHNIEDLFAFDGGQTARWLLNSVVYSSVVAVCGVALCTLAGYTLSFFPFRGRRLVWGSVVVAIMLPSAALVVPIYLLDTTLLHLQGSALAFILPSLVSPFGVYFMWVYLGGSVARELLDAGRVDGAGEFRIVWHLVRGVAMPGMLTLGAILFITTWNNFFLALIVLSHSTSFPLTVGLVQMATVLSGTSAGTGAGAVTYPEIIIGSLVSILPLTALLIVARRRIADGFGGLGGFGG